MGRNSLVFVPNALKLDQTGYLEGIYKEYEDCEAFYVLKPVTQTKALHHLGFLGPLPKGGPKVNNKKWIHMDNTTGDVEIHNIVDESIDNSIVIIYNYSDFASNNNSIEINDHGVHFNFISKQLSSTSTTSNGNCNKVLTILMGATFFTLDSILYMFDRIRPVTVYFTTITQMHESVANFKCFLSEVIKDKRISPRSGTYLGSRLFDLVLGFFVLKFIVDNEAMIVDFIAYVTETTVTSFRELLTYLMGAPIGLKLNYAFNRSLGTFFFYHISLWRIFLYSFQWVLREYCTVFFLVVGAFGFTYQVAMISDLIALATFHVYCIYVYAARLFFVQLKGLLSLWRLFIGRKFNPLRQRVDSYEYSQNQLFIGTLGFTILLFLLPTTMMYYFVFILFRLVILITEGLLQKIRNSLECVPIYVVILWILKSKELSGSLLMAFRTKIDNTVVYDANLKTLPLSICIERFATRNRPTAISSTGILHRIVTGVLI